MKMSSYRERPEPGTDSWRWEHADHVSRYLFAQEFVKGRRVLDAGTGPGYGAALLREAGALEVCAVDADEAAIAAARRQYGDLGITFRVDDCETLSSFDQMFDIICCFEVLEHLHDPMAFLRTAVRLLTEQGILLCSSPDRRAPEYEWREGKPNNPFHVNEWYVNELRVLLSQHFKQVDVLLQIKTLSYLAHVDAVESLISYMINEPVRRVWRGMGRLLGRRQIPSWAKVRELSTPSVHDFPIVPYSVSQILGRPWCLVAICREPLGLLNDIGRDIAPPAQAAEA